MYCQIILTTKLLSKIFVTFLGASGQMSVLTTRFTHISAV